MKKKKISDRELKRRRYQSLCAKHGMPLLTEDKEISLINGFEYKDNSENTWAVQSSIGGFALKTESEI
jgi:hypothetical protein